MKRRSYLILAAVAGISITAAMAIAQTPPFRRGPPSPETIQRLQEGKIAMAVTALKMTPDQLKLWAPLETQIRAGQAARLKGMQEWTERRKAGAGAPRPELTERLERMSVMMAERAERMKAFVAVFKPFHASLSEEQKQVVEPLLAELGGRRGGHHRRWAMRDGGATGPQ
jgi:LTXXQ motif family protein